MEGMGQRPFQKWDDFVFSFECGRGDSFNYQSFIFSLRVASEHILQLSKNLLNHVNSISPFHAYFTNKEDEGTLS